MKRPFRCVVGCVLLLFAIALHVPAAAAVDGKSAATTQTRPVKRAAPKPVRPKKPPARPVVKLPDTVDGCRKLYMKGDYANADKAYCKLISAKQARVAASIGLADVLAIQGKYAEAIAALEAVSADAANNAEWHVAIAEVQQTIGLYKKALKHADRAVTLRSKWAPGVLIRGVLLETLGRKKEAIANYKAAEKIFEGDAFRKDARSLVAAGLILDRHSILTGEKASEQGQNILQNYIQAAYQQVDRKYWPANVAAGMFLLSKHRSKQAMQEFKLASKLNKRIPDVLVGVGAAELGRWQFEKCLKHAGSALRINPNHADAHLLKAVCLMQWRKFDQVAPILQQILKVNPNHLEALSMFASLHVRLQQQGQAEQYIKRVREINPNYAALPTMIARWLAAARQFKQAEKYYRQAIKMEPNLAEPLTGLGLMYMQTGDEAKAKEILEKAYKLDDYRSDVVNYLRLLARLEKFLVKETDHFIVKVAPKRDEVLLDQVSAYMEQIHQEVCEDFDYTPKAKTIIEIFPTHQSFSVRISGRGWIGTVGACTGRVIALVAPTPKERSNPFGTHNWATVLRHEYTHTVTLAATENRIPHWFTEACAVWQQPDRRSYRAAQMLVGATRANRLFPVKELDWGFIRPRRAGDRSLAYAQAEWIMEYIIEKHGYATIVKMIKALRDGQTQAQMFQKILGVNESEFDKGFRAWAKKQIVAWGFQADPPLNLAKAAKAARDKPKDAAVQAAYAEALYQRRRIPQAAVYARKALKLDANNTRALKVLAGASIALKKIGEAVKYATKLEQLDRTTAVAPRILAACYLSKRMWDKAIAQLELYKQRQPLDPYSYQQLAKMYMQMGQIKRALPNLLELHRRTMKDQKYARQIAEIYRSLDQPNLALEYYRQLLQINPYETSAYEAIASIHRNAKQFTPAIAAVRNMCILNPDSATAWTRMAMIRYFAGRATKDGMQYKLAKDAAEKALKLDSGNTQAKQVLRRIEKEIGTRTAPAPKT